MIAPGRYIAGILLALAMAASLPALEVQDVRRPLTAAAPLCEKAVPAPGVAADSLTVPAYGLARISANGFDPKAALHWRVTPAASVSIATTEETRFEFTAPPGVYDVELQVISQLPDGKLKSTSNHLSVEFLKPDPPVAPPAPVDPKAPPVAGGKLDPPKALGKISFDPYSCTATVVGPRRADGKWDVLSAAHCVAHKKVGDKGSMKMLDGRTFKVTVVLFDETCDCSWLVTDDAGVGDMPYANLAKENPPAGTKIWHAGYGIDKPGNREEGEVTGPENSDGMLQMSLSVSSGDSGGGIFRADTNEIISCVCCTQRKGLKAAVWGCSANNARSRRPK